MEKIGIQKQWNSGHWLMLVYQTNPVSASVELLSL